MRLLTPDRKNRNGHPIIAADSSIAPTVLDDGWPLANDETRLFWDWQPYRYVLSRPRVAKPGTQFTLFEPLAIHEWEWVADPWRRPLAFAGLRMRPRDLATIGRLVLARGEWQGRQVVPADWVAESLRPHIATGDGLGYGYQWWTGTVDWEGKKLAWSAGFGNGGQRLFVVPELDLTVVITAGAYNDPQIRRTVTEIFRQIVASAAAIVDRADDEVGGGQARRG